MRFRLYYREKIAHMMTLVDIGRGGLRPIAPLARGVSCRRGELHKSQAGAAAVHHNLTSSVAISRLQWFWHCSFDYRTGKTRLQES